MNNWKQIALVSALLLPLATESLAADKKKLTRFPEGCHPISHTFDHYNVLIKPKAVYHPQTIFFFHNIGKETVRLVQARSGHEPFVIHTRTKIKPNLWAVYATDEPVTKFTCLVSGKKGEPAKVVNCRNYLDICEFTRTRFGTNHRGNYWVFTNMPSHKVAQYRTKRHGVLMIDNKKPKVH